MSVKAPAVGLPPPTRPRATNLTVPKATFEHWLRFLKQQGYEITEENGDYDLDGRTIRQTFYSYTIEGGGKILAAEYLHVDHRSLWTIYAGPRFLPAGGLKYEG